MRSYHTRILPKVICTLLLASTSHSVWATAFQMLEQNVTNLGTSYAGTAALAEDASTNYYNTAGLTRLNNEQIAFGGVAILPHTKLNVTRATASTGAPVPPGSGSVEPDNKALLPFFHYAKRIDERWIFGFSAVVPFGSKTNYKDGSLPRYSNTRSSMKTVDLQPSLAFEFNQNFSLGAGVDALYMIVRSDSRIGTGDVNTDGFTESTGYGSALGFHVGGLYEINDNSRLGVQYHSKITPKVKGTSTTQLAAGAPVTLLGSSAKVNLPEYVVLSAYHSFNETWAIMGDFGWTHWNQYKQLIIKFADNSQLISDQYYKNSYRIALGGTYQYNEPWQLKFGVSFDKSPIPDANRNIFIPNQNQIVPAIGAKYKICQNLALDLGYAHVFFKKDNNINQQAPRAVNTIQGAQSVQGSIRNRLEAFGLQLTWDIR